jgi:hypothetical protein
MSFIYGNLGILLSDTAFKPSFESQKQKFLPPKIPSDMERFAASLSFSM